MHTLHVHHCFRFHETNSTQLINKIYIWRDLNRWQIYFGIPRTYVWRSVNRLSPHYRLYLACVRVCTEISVLTASLQNTQFLRVSKNIQIECVRIWMQINSGCFWISYESMKLWSVCIRARKRWQLDNGVSQNCLSKFELLCLSVVHITFANWKPIFCYPNSHSFTNWKPFLQLTGIRKSSIIIGIEFIRK